MEDHPVGAGALGAHRGLEATGGTLEGDPLTVETVVVVASRALVGKVGAVGNPVTDLSISGPVTNSILFCWLLPINKLCKPVRFYRTHTKGLHQLFLTVSWDLRA